MKKVTKVMLGVVGATSLGLFTGEPVVQADELLPQIGEGYLKSVNQSTIDRMSTMSYALSFQMYQWGDIGVNERLTGNEYNPRNVSSQAYSVGVNSDMGTRQTSRTVNTSVFHNSTNQNQTKIKRLRHLLTRRLIRIQQQLRPRNLLGYQHRLAQRSVYQCLVLQPWVLN